MRQNYIYFPHNIPSTLFLFTFFCLHSDLEPFVPWRAKTLNKVDEHSPIHFLRYSDGGWFLGAAKLILRFRAREPMIFRLLMNNVHFQINIETQT